MLERNKKKQFGKQDGFSLPELIIVLLVGAILLVLALPQMMSSSRLFKFSSMQRQVSTTLVEARQEAMSQRRAVTFLYDHAAKKIVLYGGEFGNLGDAGNKQIDLAGSGVLSDDIKYGRPAGVSSASLSDTANLTALVNNKVEITFQPDGSVIDASNNPQNKALFFYHNGYQKDSAFAVSILGAGGRVKVWRYSKGVNSYVE